MSLEKDVSWYCLVIGILCTEENNGSLRAVDCSHIVIYDFLTACKVDTLFFSSVVLPLQSLFSFVANDLVDDKFPALSFASPVLV